MTSQLTLAVDRLESSTALLIADDGREFVVPRKSLPQDGRREGAILRVELNDAGDPVWSTARVDVAEERRRLEDARRRLDVLKRSDPGGDISL